MLRWTAIGLFGLLVTTCPVAAQQPLPERPAGDAPKATDAPKASGDSKATDESKPGDAPKTRAIPKTTERTYRGPYDAGTCRELFRACDADGDDRLDVFEASSALDSMRDVRDVDGFARLDSDRDGFVGWPEFDATFRQALQQRGAFRVRTCRRLGGDGRSGTELQQFLQLHDADRNGGLDPAEIEQIVRLGTVPPGHAGKLRSLDHDGSGRIDEAELAPWFEQLPRPNRMPPERPGAGSLLPPPWNLCDDDKDNQVGVAELSLALRRLDPTLERWTQALLQRLDRSHDGHVQRAELQAGDGPAAAGILPPLPKQSPLR